jgi:hypothetical protein
LLPSGRWIFTVAVKLLPANLPLTFQVRPGLQVGLLPLPAIVFLTLL